MLTLNHSRARSIAETAWGTGGTSAYRTNRKGAYYFSCSGHGGYVVDGACLSDQERELIDEHVKPRKAFYASRNGDCYFLQNPESFRSRRYRIYPDTVTGWTDIYLFEEDCDWAVLEYFTDIQAKGWASPESDRAAIVAGTFARWHCQKATA